MNRPRRNQRVRLRDLEKRMCALEEELLGPPNPDPDMVAKYRADIARKVLALEPERKPREPL